MEKLLFTFGYLYVFAVSNGQCSSHQRQQRSSSKIQSENGTGDVLRRALCRCRETIHPHTLRKHLFAFKFICEHHFDSIRLSFSALCSPWLPDADVRPLWIVNDMRKRYLCIPCAMSHQQQQHQHQPITSSNIRLLSRGNDLLAQSSTETLLEMLKSHAGIKECSDETALHINGVCTVEKRVKSLFFPIASLCSSAAASASFRMLFSPGFPLSFVRLVRRQAAHKRVIAMCIRACIGGETERAR